MKKAALFVVVGLLAAAASVAVAAEDGKVEVLTDADYDARTGEGVWLVKYFAPWCGHCKRLAPTWEELAKTAAGSGLHVGEVDCVASPQTCQKMQIRGYPTVKMLEPGHDAVDARVPRTVKSYVDFVLNAAKTENFAGRLKAPEDAPAEGAQQQQQQQQQKPKEAVPPPPPKPKADGEEKPADSAVVVLTGETFDAEVAKGPMLVKFYAPWCGHCKRLAPTWEELAHKAKKADAKFRVAEVDTTAHRDLASRFGIRGIPTIFFVAPGAAKEGVRFEGDRTVDAFVKFAEDELAKLPKEEEADAKPHSEL